MRSMSTTIVTLLAIGIGSGYGAFAQDPKAPDASSQPAQDAPRPPLETPSTYRLEFLGKDPAADWAKAVIALNDKALVPTKTLTLGKGQDPCGAVLDQLNFRSLGFGCSAEMQSLIAKLNPGLSAKPLQIGQEIRYPDLPVQQLPWRAGFNLAIPEDRDRYLKVNSLWKQFKDSEKQAGSQRQVQFKGIASELNVPIESVTPELRKEIEKIEAYSSDLGRFQTRAVAREKEPDIKSRFALATPIDLAPKCSLSEDERPKPPYPSYITLLNVTERPACATQCTQPNSPNCPQIILIDQSVAAHPDIAPAMGVASGQSANLGTASAPATPKWCPFGDYKPDANHGTHLAGIMVSSGESTGFAGIAPNVRLDSRNIPDSGIKDLLDEKFAAPGIKIYVYAGQFASDHTIVNGETRRSKPAVVEDILSSNGLWIVAAGQQPKVDIGKRTRFSPMNLGDQKNVVAVTSCDDCYGKSVSLSSWANNSSEKLLTLAAPGGEDGRRIPSTISATQFGLAYGTSQATALVAGLAASMAACYPQRFNMVTLLKQRLETIARPAPSDDVSTSVSAGIIDASLAFKDPDLQWIKLDGDVLKSSPNAWFCTERVRLQRVSDGTELAPIPVKQLRAIFREERGDLTGWRFKYQIKKETPIETTDLVKLVVDSSGDSTPRPPKPLFYVDNARELQLPSLITLDRVETLVLGLQPPKVSTPRACQP